MASLKDLRNRIASVKATQKITKAMQMVAAAKLRRAQEAAEAARPYSQRMATVLANIAQAVGGGGEAPALMTGTGKDRGRICWSLHRPSAACAAASTRRSRVSRASTSAGCWPTARRSRSSPSATRATTSCAATFAALIIDRVDLREVKQIGFVNADAIARKIIELFAEGEFDVCTLFYSEFKSVISQVPTALQIIPAALDWRCKAGRWRGRRLRIRAGPGEILTDLLPRNISVQVFRALLENAAGEMGAKMSAMDNATRNAGDMINKLTLIYNRQRQAQITKELIEIISGAEAL